MRVQKLYTFATIANIWNLLAIVIKSSILDIARFSESITGRKLNKSLDLKLKFTLTLHNLFEK